MQQETRIHSTQSLLFEAKGFFFFVNQYLFPAWKSPFEMKLCMWPFGANYQMLIWMLSFTEAEKGKNAKSSQCINTLKNIYIIFLPERWGFEVLLMNTRHSALLLRSTAFIGVRWNYRWSEKWVSHPNIVLRISEIPLLWREKKNPKSIHFYDLILQNHNV